MVDARKLAGWVTAPDGHQMPCPRCEGDAFIRLDGVGTSHAALAETARSPPAMVTQQLAACCLLHCLEQYLHSDA